MPANGETSLLLAAGCLAVFMNRHVSPIQSERAPTGLWAAPLDESIPLAIAANLSGAEIPAVGFWPHQRPPAHTLDVIIRFTHFEGRQAGDVMVAGNWRIVSSNGGRWRLIPSRFVVRAGSRPATRDWSRS